MSAGEGWHPIHRSLLRHWIWADKPFSAGQAWVDLILLANHAHSKVMLRGRLYEVNPGQVFRSKLVLGERWGWSRNRAQRFLKLLEKEAMITQQTGQHATLITILNYKRFHEMAQNKGTAPESPDDTPEEHQTDSGRSTYNNDNNEKNEKNENKNGVGVNQKKSQIKTVIADRDINRPDVISDIHRKFGYETIRIYQCLEESKDKEDPGTYFLQLLALRKFEPSDRIQASAKARMNEDAIRRKPALLSDLTSAVSENMGQRK